MPLGKRITQRSRSAKMRRLKSRIKLFQLEAKTPLSPFGVPKAGIKVRSAAKKKPKVTNAQAHADMYVKIKIGHG